MSTTWDTNWKERLQTQITSRGFSSMTKLVDAYPKASYEEVASMFDDIAPIQIQWLHSEESDAESERLRFLKTSLVRYLLRHVPNGIRCHGDWPLTLALGSWAGSMPEEEQHLCSAIVRKFASLAKSMPDDWLPTEDDSDFQKVFRDSVS